MESTITEAKRKADELKAQLNAIEADRRVSPTVLDEDEFAELGPASRRGLGYSEYVAYCRNRAAQHKTLFRAWETASNEYLKAIGA
jgi:hypothetical protein